MKYATKLELECSTSDSINVIVIVINLVFLILFIFELRSILHLKMSILSISNADKVLNKFNLSRLKNKTQFSSMCTSFKVS